MISYAIAFAIIGVVLHIVDIIVGKDWYRSLWNSVHPTPLSDNVTRGFITGRSTKERLLTSFVITVIFAVLMYKLGDQKLLTLLGDCLGIFVGLLVGFAVGGFFKRRTNIEAAANTVLESLDKVDHGDLPDVRRMAADVAAGAEKLGQRAVDAVIDQTNRAVDTAVGVPGRIAAAVTGESTPTVRPAKVSKGNGAADPSATVEPQMPAAPTKGVSVSDAVRKFKNRG